MYLSVFLNWLTKFGLAPYDLFVLTSLVQILDWDLLNQPIN